MEIGMLGMVINIIVNNMFDFKTLLVEATITCPMCDRYLNIGDIMYKDEYRNETMCGYCKDEYKESVIAEEGEDGRGLK